MTRTLGNRLLGICIKMNGGSVSWKSKLQETTALSSTEGVYRPMALGQALKELLWIKGLLKG